MKTYRGIVKGNIVILEETPDFPDKTEAIISIKAIGKIKGEGIAERQLGLLRNPHRGGTLLY